MPQEDEEWSLPDPASLSNPDQAISQNEEPNLLAGVLDHHRDELMARPGVTMVGETRDASGRPAIMVGVMTAADLSNLPGNIEGVPIVGVVTGVIDALRTGG
jgi:hypothetical protein